MLTDEEIQGKVLQGFFNMNFVDVSSEVQHSMNRLIKQLLRKKQIESYIIQTAVVLLRIHV